MAIILNYNTELSTVDCIDVGVECITAFVTTINNNNYIHTEYEIYLYLHWISRVDSLPSLF